jgi:thiamine-phosphate diphosphorylase
MHAVSASPKDIFRRSPQRIYCFADTPELCRRLLGAGARVIQLRHKTADDAAFRRLAAAMLACVRTVEDALLIVNDRVEIAREVGADGIHVGQEDLDCREVVRRVPPAMIVGVSARTPDLARRAAAAGATYVGAGAVFATATKPEAEVIGLKGLSAVAASVEIPVVAIGGITLEAVRPVLAAGARYCAVISGINDAPDPALALARFLAAAAALPPDQQP